ncbi:hypothetical protein RUND412_004814 [Rhizina undulata]
MLKVKALNQVLSQSLNQNVTSAIIFTPTGNVLATGTSPTAPDAKKSRTYAALAANIWGNYARVAEGGIIGQSLPNPSSQQLSAPPPSPPFHDHYSNGYDSPSQDFQPVDGLKSLTFELSEYNFHIEQVAPRVLLCLIGPKQPTRHTSSSSSLHSQDGERITPPGSVPRSGGSGSGGSGGTTPAVASTRGSHNTAAHALSGGSSLGILKAQAKALVNYLQTQLKDLEPPQM